MIGAALGLLLTVATPSAAAGDAVGLPAPPPLTPPSADFDRRRFRRGRRVSVAGLFLGWAGPGLALSGGVLALTRPPDGPLSGREIIQATTLAGAGLTAAGLGLQLGGSHLQSGALAAVGAPTQRRWRRAGLVFSGAGLVLSGIVAWRIADDAPDGLWITVGAPAAGLTVLAATGAHTAALLQADAEAEDVAPGLRLSVAPHRHGVDVGITGVW